MFRSNGPPPSPNTNLPRRYQAVRDRQQRGGFRSSTQESNQDVPGSLELSMHMPTQPSANRFDVLKLPSPSPNRVKEPFSAPPSRRSRHSRGSRRARRRRDERRDRRRQQAARSLDQQLSKDIDKMLSQANIQRPLPQNLPRPTPISPPKCLPSPQPIRMPPTPPQLPYLNFGGLDLLNDCPPLSPSMPPPSPPVIPSWCPPLPSFVNHNLKWSEFPIFFDLSSLPEPSESENKCQEMQLWRPKISPQPKKQSRFFPAPVRPPPMGCKLHSSDEGSPATKPASLAESVEQVVQAKSRNNNNDDDDEESLASAANPCRILTSREPPAHDQAYSENFTFPLVDSAYENTAVLPFVHANSLTGHANERGSPRGGLHELPYYTYPEEEEEALQLPPLPPSPQGSGSVIHEEAIEDDSPDEDIVDVAAFFPETCWEIIGPVDDEDWEWEWGSPMSVGAEASRDGEVFLWTSQPNSVAHGAW